MDELKITDTTLQDWACDRANKLNVFSEKNICNVLKENT